MDAQKETLYEIFYRLYRHKCYVLSVYETIKGDNGNVCPGSKYNILQLWKKV